MKVLLVLVLTLIIACPPCSCQYDLSNIVRGNRISIHDEMCVSASNSFSNFGVVIYPFRNLTVGGQIRCNVRFSTTDRYVHSVAVVGTAKYSNNSDTFLFVFSAELMSTGVPQICVGTVVVIHRFNCSYSVQCTNLAPPGSRQEFFPIAVDSSGTFAVGLMNATVFKFDIYANTIVMSRTLEEMWPSTGFTPRAIELADTWAVVAGYGYNDTVRKNYAVYACYVNVTTLTTSRCLQLITEASFIVPANLIQYNEQYELSVAIRGQRVLIGVHRLETILILQTRQSSLSLSRTIVLSSSESVSTGRIVDWADDTTIAVLIVNPDQTSWSKSQIFFFDETSVSLKTPYFTFPNNQQTLGTRLQRPFFARFGITPTGNMAILTSVADVLIIPLSPAGYATKWVDPYIRSFLFFYESDLCIAGTYKNRSSLGPCQICPPRTRNPGGDLSSALRCIPCPLANSTSFCPLASLSEIALSNVSSYSQATAYPETGDTNNIEDILIKNMFQIGSEPSCLVISPLLWTLVVSGMCILGLLLMVMLKLCGCSRCNNCQKKAKNIFRHTDIIGEGEMWAGGLATLAIVVLVSFSYWFSASFIQRYPIEEIFEPARFSCDQAIINAQFTSGLELLALPKSPEVQPIFDLLDEQVFHLTVELVNTGFNCSNITAQENLIGAKYVPLNISCNKADADAITAVTFPLPKHQTIVQVNMTGPFWIGAVRLCIRGHGFINGSRTLRELDFCEFYSTPNEAVGRMTIIPIVFVKDINITQPLSNNGTIRYSGLWMPTFGTVSLSDESYYTEFGNHLRYVSSSTIIQIDLDERPFYIKNVQQPIVRMAELIFHGLLFTSLCIELFAFSFLLIKLLLVPIFGWMTFLWKKLNARDDKSSDSNETGETPLQKYLAETNHPVWKVDLNDPTMAVESDVPAFQSTRKVQHTQRHSVMDGESEGSAVVCRL